MRGSDRNPSVGIVTIFDCDNYGAELQAYALPRALRGRGFDARLIDYPFYKSPRFRRTPLAAPVLPLAPANALKERVMAARRACLRRLAGKAARRRDAAFAAFRASIPRTEPFLSFDDLLRAPPAFDAYLTGSDQVWNPRMGATLRPCFLDFLPEGARRLAYAASFGVSALPPPVEAQYRRWLSRYEAIGCREASGAALAARLCPQTPVAHVLDPTLLLTAQEWRAVAAPPDAARPYLLVYELVRAPGLWPLARRWAAARGWEVVRLCGAPWERPRPGARAVAEAGPADFVGLFAGAGAVLTTSFHGTVFSLLFSKPFYSIVPAGMANAGRQASLLQALGAASRLIPESQAPGLDPSEALDWLALQGALGKARADSLAFLENALLGGPRHAP